MGYLGGGARDHDEFTLVTEPDSVEGTRLTRRRHLVS
jgi:hypothetical protein